jgi:hypothetical protein
MVSDERCGGSVHRLFTFACPTCGKGHESVEKERLPLRVPCLGSLVYHRPHRRVQRLERRVPLCSTYFVTLLSSRCACTDDRRARTPASTANISAGVGRRLGTQKHTVAAPSFTFASSQGSKGTPYLAVVGAVCKARCNEEERAHTNDQGHHVRHHRYLGCVSHSSSEAWPCPSGFTRRL